MSKPLSKRVFCNISNLRNDDKDRDDRKTVKRSRDLNVSPNRSLKKRSRGDKQVVQQNNENEEIEKKPELKDCKADPTLTIERKVKAIDISSKSETKSPMRQYLSVSADISRDSRMSDESFEAKAIDFTDPITYYCPPINIPETIEDFDKSQLSSIESEPHYAFEIFHYYRQRELKVPTKKYMSDQPELNKQMRAVLVDWMVEVQESFELNHETLYLAVKVIDQFLMRQKVSKNDFQLVGATALLIAAKFDERIPPAIEDFLYICDDAYSRRDVIVMEMNILRTLEFDLCYPISYRFLRRYARCAKLTMETLTLARFILEMSLMEYEIIEEADSRVAAAALLLALKMRGQSQWTQTLEYFSGYKEEDLKILMYRLNNLISTPNKQKTIRTKYSHKIFFEVAKTPCLPRVKA